MLPILHENGGVPSVPAPRNQQERALLAAVWDEFELQGSWPTFGKVDRRLDRQPVPLDAEALLRSAPAELLQPGGLLHPPQDDQELRLTIAGVAACGAGESGLYVRLFLDTVRLACEAEQELPLAAGDKPLLTSEDANRRLPLPAAGRAEVLWRLGQVLLVEQWGYNVSGTNSENQSWSFAISRQVRRFRGLQDLADYWQRAHPQVDRPSSAPQEALTTTGDVPAVLPPTRYQVFLSSTFADLEQERALVTQAILRTQRCIPAGMELFPASSLPPWDVITPVIDLTDYFVLVIAARYGSLTPEGVSYTEREYEYARNAGVPVLAFVHRDPDALPVRNAERDEASRAKLREFVERVESRHTVQRWTTAEQLASLVQASLYQAFDAQPRPGWTRGGSDSTGGPAPSFPVASVSSVDELRSAATDPAREGHLLDQVRQEAD